MGSEMCIRDRYKRMGWRLTGTVLNVYDPENDAFTEKYCEEWQMRYRG